jgi:RHS repeat-associated protein
MIKTGYQRNITTCSAYHSLTAFVNVIALLLLGVPAKAQMESGISNKKFGSPAIYSSITNPGQNPPNQQIALGQGASNEVSYPASNEVDRKIKNIITLEIDEKNHQKFIPDNFTATVRVRIEYGASPSSLNTLTQDLTVNYKKGEGEKYNAKNYFSFDNAEFVRITVTDQPTISPATFPSGFNPIDVLTLNNEMRFTQYFDLASAANVTFSSSAINDDDHPDELKVSWNPLLNKGLNAYQLEWTWLENEMAEFYTSGGVLNTELLFRNNSTRVDLPSNFSEYSIPLYYDGRGKLYYRIRAVNVKPNGSRADGPWTLGTPYSFNGHGSETNGTDVKLNAFNWQVSTSYAEEGKRKTVMQYFDGSLRSRQTVTKDNASKTVVTAETFYDGQGRPAVQVLPTPGISQVITYQNNLNLFNNQTPGTDPAIMFDLQPLTLPTGVSPNFVPGLDHSAVINPGNANVENRGASRYYSSANPDINAGSNKYIPDAEDYPFTVTRYTPDGTGRIMAQSGVGYAMQMGSKHETKYYYGGATQQELDGLFGTEVGNYTHYFKNMVQDANGQMSVSYVDMHGRTIATALAGEAPTNLNSIKPLTLDDPDYPNQSGTTITRNLIGNYNNTIKNNRSVESVNTILVPVRGNYVFTYTLDPQKLTLPSCTSGDVCYNCMYDLEISITDESGENPPYVERFSNAKSTEDDDCSGSAPPFHTEDGHTEANRVVINRTLEPGSYIVRKTLTISEAAFQRNKELFSIYAKKFCLNEQEIVDSIASALCSSVTWDCETCISQLGGSLHGYANRYFDTDNASPEQEEQVRVQFETMKERCDLLCSEASPLLASKRTMMLADMVPYTGQYAMDPANPLQGIDVNSGSYRKYDIFSTANASTQAQPFFKHPQNPDGTPGLYQNDYGQTDFTIHPDPSNPYSFLNNTSTTRTVFEPMFRTRWAEALLPYHPEYPKLRYAENYLTSSYDYIGRFSKPSTYADARNFGFIITSSTELNNDNFYSDPGRITYRNEMAGWITGHYKMVAGDPSVPSSQVWASMWQLAYATVICVNVTNPTQQLNCFTQIPTVPTNSNEYSLLTDAQKDRLWNAFKGFYQMERENHLNDFLNDQFPALQSDFTDLVNDHYLLHFAKNNNQLAQQLGWLWYPATPGGNPTIPTPPGYSGGGTASSNSPCESYIESWKQSLLQCSQITSLPATTQANLLADVTTRMKAVCVYGTDAANPQGSSTVKPGSPVTAANASFEAVINDVFRIYGINQTNLCNPYLIEFPKPYGKNPQMALPTISTIEDCHCTQFAQIKSNAATALGVSAGSITLLQLNQYVSQYYGETITEDLFDALQQHCGEPQQEVCTTTYDTSYQNCSSLPDGCTFLSTVPNSDGKCQTVCARQTCGYYIFQLPEEQPLPSFLVCNADINTHCLTCAGLSQLTGEFCSIFTAAAPNFTGNNLSTADVERNVLFARFINFRTGFQYSWIDYAKAAENASPQCDLSHYTGNGEATQTVVCPDKRPINDITSIFEEERPCQKANDMAVYIGQELYQARLNALLASFEAQYLSKCLEAKSIEQFNVTYINSEYHYTLYYYDQAGNLVKTVPPKGVHPDFSTGFYDLVEAARKNDKIFPASHTFATEYRYNSLGQVVAQHTPDAHEAYFWYDRLGRLVVSQNAKQAPENKYSYTRYDKIGRIIEVGQCHHSNPMSDEISGNDSNLADWLTSSSEPEQVTYTGYDEGLPQGVGSITFFEQHNLRNRVSYTFTRKLANQPDYVDAGTYYSYDVHGNVNEMVQDLREAMALAGAPTGNRWKRVTYNYDLISGKVNAVNYQPDEKDAFYHQYKYDAENRIVAVKTSRDGIVWEQDAAYSYYKHGPLARMVLGHLEVQGVDYAYTLQGWLKGVNSTAISNLPGGTCVTGTSHDVLNLYLRSQYGKPAQYIARREINFLNEFTSDINDEFVASISPTDADCVPADGGYVGGTQTGDIGRDGDPSSLVARDAYGFGLNYYSQDYKPVGGTAYVPFATNVYNLPAVQDGQVTGAELYNGNIASMMVSLPKLATLNGNTGAGELLYGYRYDQLNRLVGMNSYKGLNKASNTATPVGLSDYLERISYDPNGNIRTYLRNGTQTPYGSPAPVQRPIGMDQLTYHYGTTSNQLAYVDDAVGGTNYTEDIDDQNTGNYTYDAIGNLVRDNAAGIRSVSWTVYGKIAAVEKTAGSVTYTYDATGGRVSKTAAGKTTVYVRDAQGNVMSVYEGVSATATLVQKESYLYGSSRLGLSGELTVAAQRITVAVGYGDEQDKGVLGTFTRGEKVLELGNHLSNVLATVSDKLLPVGNGSNVDYYLPDVVSTGDYVPFGMAMVGRTYNSDKYRYAFNGKELDKDISEDDYDYGMRIYDAKLGRFLSVDPLTPQYPYYTPYQFAGNKPIAFIDRDGEEEAPSISANNQSNAAFLRGSTDALRNAQMLGAGDKLPDWLGGTDHSNDYSSDYLKAAYLRGRLAGDATAIAMAHVEMTGGAGMMQQGGAVVLATGGGGGVTALVGGGEAIVGGLLAGHGALTVYHAGKDVIATGKKLFQLNAASSDAANPSNSTQKKADQANNGVQNNGRINVKKPKLGPGRHDKVWDGKDNKLYNRTNGGTDAPSNSKELFAKAVPDEGGKNWFAKDASGNYHRFSSTTTNDGEILTVHWNGSTESDRSIPVSKYVKERLKNQ